MRTLLALLAGRSPLLAQSAGHLSFSKRRSGRSSPPSAMRCHGAQDADGRAESVVAGGTRRRWWSPRATPSTAGCIARSATPDKIKMPPAGKLPEPENRRSRTWIEMGAPRRRRTLPVSVTNDRAERPKHWAFQPVNDTPPPAVKNAAWAQSPDRSVHPGEAGREGHSARRRPRRS